MSSGARHEVAVDASRPGVRAVAFAAAAVPVSAAVHVWVGGGMRPGVDALAVSTLVAYVAHRFVIGSRQRSLPTSVVALGAMQGVLHLVMSLGSGTHMAAAGEAPVHAIHPMTTGASPLAMLVAHLAACVVLGRLLHAGESAFWAAARRWLWSCAASVALFCAARPQPASRRLAAPHVPDSPAPLRRRQRHWSGGQIRRGPPAALAAA